MNDICVIVTGTIVPNVLIHGHEDFAVATRQSELEDAATRRSRYLETLSSYASIIDIPIYFLENSSYDFTKDIEFQNLFHQTRITLVKFPKSRFFERGKGCQEFEMLDEFITSLSGQYRAFVKITGRYQYRNINSIICTHVEGMLIDMHRKQRVAITSVFCATFDFYKKHLMGLYLEADDSQGMWVERRLYQQLRGKVFQQSVQLFSVEPDLRDWTRSAGEDKAGSKITRLKHSVRNIERAILRKLGVNELYL